MTQESHRETEASKPRTLVLPWLVVLVVGAFVVAATGVSAQDSSHVRRPKKPRKASQADTTRTDTTHIIHVAIDSSNVDSLVLDTLRRAVIRDSVRAVNRRDSTENALNCQGRRITRIDVRPQPPYLAAPPNHPRVAGFLRWLMGLHKTTRVPVIRRFLALRVGGVCDETRRQESERLLRAQPFIEQAHISAFPDGPDGVRLDVFTVDEIAGNIGLGFEAQSPLIKLVGLGNGNLFGDALRVSGEWAHEGGYRDRWMGDFTDYQFLGHPWVADATADLDHVGGHVDGSVSHPYFTNLQRIGWRLAAGSDHDYFQFRRVGGHYPSLDLERVYTNAGGLFRVGSAARFESAAPDEPVTRYSALALVGAAVSYEDDGIGGRPVNLTSGGPIPDTSTAAKALPGLYPRHDVRRINGLAGFRAVRYLTVRGFDALLGEEDVPLGIQASGVVGRSVPWIGQSGDPDIFVSARMDAGAGTARSVVQGSVQAEARRDVHTGVWDGLIVSGHAAWYLKPSLSRTVIVTADGALGQSVRVPFQLALADPQGGVEGYGGDQVAGGARTTTRAEYRQLFRMPLTVLRSAASWGFAGFLTGGRVWAAGAPYGVTSPIVVGAGAGILVGFPRESRQLWRLDITEPLIAQPHAGWELRVSTSSAIRIWWTEPSDVSRSRERTVAPALFSYP